jgi:hypothetical protein
MDSDVLWELASPCSATAPATEYFMFFVILYYALQNFSSFYLARI